MPEEGDRFGLAYGSEDIPYAIATRELMLDRLNAVEEQNVSSVQQFVSTVREYFSR